MHVAIVGAGMAGLACATRLQAAGHRVTLFDKGRGPGGRMATRRMPTPLGEAAFDHGAQYFTVRDLGFRGQVAAWQAAGCAAPWPAAGQDAWVGTPAMNAPVKALAAGMDVQWATQVGELRPAGSGWALPGIATAAASYDAAVVAIPAEQAATLLAPCNAGFAALAQRTASAPCWTAMAAFATPVVTAADTMRDDPVVGWAARNTAKPGRSGPESWVIQASPDWSRAHLEQTPADILPLLLQAFALMTGAALPEPVASAAHRWRYAKSGSAGPGLLWDAQSRLGVCGDWLAAPRVEATWLSGTNLAAAISA